jgi:hypothetical protein
MNLIKKDVVDGLEVGLIFVSYRNFQAPRGQWFCFDSELVSVLGNVGRFHIRDVEKPGSKPAYVRRKIGGVTKELRLPHVCFTLREALKSQEDVDALSRDWLELTRRCDLNRGRIEALPMNGKAVDCRVDNWVLDEALLASEQITSMKVNRASQEFHSEANPDDDSVVGKPAGWIDVAPIEEFLIANPEKREMINDLRRKNGLNPFDSFGQEIVPPTTKEIISGAFPKTADASPTDNGQPPISGGGNS